jgi:hypothetical protein
VIAKDTFDVAVAGDEGHVVVWRAGSGEVERIGKVTTPGIITRLAMSRDGVHVLALYSGETDGSREHGRLYLWDGTRGHTERWVKTDDDGFFSYLPQEPEHIGSARAVCVYGYDSVARYEVPSLLRAGSAANGTSGEDILLSIAHRQSGWRWQSDQIFRRRDGGGRPNPLNFGTGEVCGAARIPWKPAGPLNAPWIYPPVAYLTPTDDSLEITGVAADGTAYWTGVRWDGVALHAVTAALGCGDGYRAVGFVAPGQLVAATAGGEVEWLRHDGSPVLRKYGPVRRLGVPGLPVFVAPRPQANEVLVVLADGTGVRVPGP